MRRSRRAARLKRIGPSNNGSMAQTSSRALTTQLRGNGGCSPFFMCTARLTPKTTFAGSASGLYPRGKPGVAIITWPGTGLKKQPRLDRLTNPDDYLPLNPTIVLTPS